MFSQTDTILRRWLQQQTQMISGTLRAILLTVPEDDGPCEHTVQWPEENCDLATLQTVAIAARTNLQPVLKPRSNSLDGTGEPLDAVACPLQLDGRLFGVVALEMTHRAEALQRAAIHQLQTGASWLETLLQLLQAGSQDQLLQIIDLVAACLDRDSFRVAASDVVNLLARHLSCTQVCLGFMDHGSVRLAAISRVDTIDQGAELPRAIREAMGEALDQGGSIVVPHPDEARAVQVIRFHLQLASLLQGAALCTLPLIRNGRAVGALLLQRPDDKPFDADTVARGEQIALLIGPVLESRRREERSIPTHIFDRLRTGLGRLFGPRHYRFKAVAALSVLLLAGLTLIQGTMRISCNSVLEAAECRVIVAPQQGFIARAPVRAGDLVRRGDILATLDDRELLLQQDKWRSQQAQLIKESRQAMAGMNRAELAILNARQAQAEAELRLIDERLARTVLAAPFSGLVVTGDLSQSIGSPVEAGAELFEVAPVDTYRVVIRVDDRDMALVTRGQRGLLKLSSMPEREIPVTIARVTPVSAAEKGRILFRVEADLQWKSDLMRPGMEGVTKIDLGQESLLWIWTRRLVEWLRLFTWNHLP